MNVDDPKLTAYALDELDEPERSAIARAIAVRSDSSNSSSAYAVSFGSSTFILTHWFWVKWDEICGDVTVTLSQRL